jgi:hypothetical protein
MRFERSFINDNEVNNGTFISKIIKYIKSSREMSVQTENNVAVISFFHIPASEIKRNWALGVFLIIGFCVIPVLLGFTQVLLELLSGNEEDQYVRYYMYFLLVFYWIPPIFVFKVVIIPFFSIRTVIMEHGQLTVLDRFFGGKPKIRAHLLKNNIKGAAYKEKSFIEKILNLHEDKTLLLIYDRGKYELISIHSYDDIDRIKSIIDDWITKA